MPRLDLNRLIEAIAGAVTEAQEQVQRFQIASVLDYFDRDNRPRTLNLKLTMGQRIPIEKDGTEGDPVAIERELPVPLLSIAAPQLLGIKTVEINFTVGLTGVETEDDDAVQFRKPTVSADSLLRADRVKSVLGVDLGETRRAPGATATVKLVVESLPMSEGLSRVIQNLDRLITTDSTTKVENEQ